MIVFVRRPHEVMGHMWPAGLEFYTPVYCVETMITTLSHQTVCFGALWWLL